MFVCYRQKNKKNKSRAEGIEAGEGRRWVDVGMSDVLSKEMGSGIKTNGVDAENLGEGGIRN